MKENNLINSERAEKYLQLIEREWDFEKNNKQSIYPHQIKINDRTTKVYWKCKYGHSWQATVYNRTKNIKPTKCPYCSGKSFGEFALLYYLEKYFDKSVVKSRVPLKELLPQIPDKSRLEADIAVTADNAKLIIEHSSYLYHSSEDRVASDAEKARYIQSFGNYRLVRFYAYKDSKEKLPAEYYYREGNFSQMELAVKKFFKEKIDKDYSGKLDINIREHCMQILAKFYPAKFVECKDNAKRIKRIELASDWDIERNAGYTIFNFPPRSSFYAHWKCKDCGYEWTSLISNRFTRDCPSTICRSKRIMRRKSRELAPDDSFYCRCRDKAILYWDFENNIVKPNEIHYRSNVKINFKCGKHNEFWASTTKRMNNALFGCRFCGSESSAVKKLKPIFQLDPVSREVVKKYDSREEVISAGFREVLKEREGKTKYLNSGKPFRNFLWTDEFEYKETAEIVCTDNIFNKGKLAMINAITKEVVLFASRKEAKTEYKNINTYIKKGYMIKNNIQYFWIDLAVERNKNEDSLLLKYLEFYM